MFYYCSYSARASRPTRSLLDYDRGLVKASIREWEAPDYAAAARYANRRRFGAVLLQVPARPIAHPRAHMLTAVTCPFAYCCTCPFAYCCTCLFAYFCTSLQHTHTFT